MKAIYTGSFDPLTLGHFNIIQRTSKMFDEVVILVASNVEKEPMFSIDERLNMLRNSCKEFPNVAIESFDGLIADYVNENNIDVVVRGLRNPDDFAYELEMAQYNANLFCKDAETIFLMTAPEYSYISSSGVREILSLKGDISGLVPEFVKNYMEER